jgi:hypothetical protein
MTHAERQLLQLINGQKRITEALDRATELGLKPVAERFAERAALHQRRL